MAGRDLVRVRDYEREKNVAGLLNALDSDSKDARCYAVCALGRLRASDAIPRVEDLLRDPDKMVRMYACDVLGVLGATDAESQLVGALKDPDALVREAAAGALCRIRTEANISSLRDALRPVAAADSVGGCPVRSGGVASRSRRPNRRRSNPPGRSTPAVASPALQSSREASEGSRRIGRAAQPGTPALGNTRGLVDAKPAQGSLRNTGPGEQPLARTRSCAAGKSVHRERVMLQFGPLAQHTA